VVVALEGAAHFDPALVLGVEVGDELVEDLPVRGVHAVPELDLDRLVQIFQDLGARHFHVAHVATGPFTRTPGEDQTQAQEQGGRTDTPSFGGWSHAVSLPLFPERPHRSRPRTVTSRRPR